MLTFNNIAADSFAGDTQQGASRPRPRHRNTASCLQCRDRKVLCDRKQPCKQCHAAGYDASCSYKPTKHALVDDENEAGPPSVSQVLYPSNQARKRTSGPSSTTSSRASSFTKPGPLLDAVRDMHKRGAFESNEEAVFDPISFSDQPRGTESDSEDNVSTLSNSTRMPENSNLLRTTSTPSNQARKRISRPASGASSRASSISSHMNLASSATLVRRTDKHEISKVAPDTVLDQALGERFNQPLEDLSQITAQITQAVLTQLKGPSPVPPALVYDSEPTDARAKSAIPSSTRGRSPSVDNVNVFDFISGASSPAEPSTDQDIETRILELRWGKLFDEHRNPTLKLHQLFRSIAFSIIQDFNPGGNIVILPVMMQKYYLMNTVEGEVYPWAQVFDVRTSSISRIFCELEIEHFLVQENSFSQKPELPALTTRGFATWMITVLQAHPDVEYKRLAHIVSHTSLINPDTFGKKFPNHITRALFPAVSDVLIASKLQKALHTHCNGRIATPEVPKPCVTKSPEVSQMDNAESSAEVQSPGDIEIATLSQQTLRPAALVPIMEDEGIVSGALAIGGSTTENVNAQVESEPSGLARPAEKSIEVPQRVTWTCSCGTQLYDDYIERVPGSLDALQALLRAQHRPSSINLQRLLSWLTLQSSSSTLTTNNGEQSRESTSPPASIAQSTVSQGESFGDQQQNQRIAPPPNGSVITTTDSSTPALPSQLDPFVSYLLLCIPEGLSGLKLHHQQILRSTTRDRLPNHVFNDKELFKLLRKVYASKRKVVVSWLWPKTVIRASLAYFLVDLPGYVELKHYSCRGLDADCKCLPPKALLHPSRDAQYHCSPQDPPFKPPIGTNYLTHYFQNDCIQSDQLDFVLNQIPKRLGQCMATSGRLRLEAWGLEFEEGWDRGRLRNALFAIFVFGSLLFAILWSTFVKDLSSAFQISGFAIAVLTLVGGYVASAEPRVVHR